MSDMSSAAIPVELGSARERFLGLVAEVRPELHRYCTRIVGSAVQGEDIVQDVLAKAFYAISMSTEVPALRPWLFRIAHNTALDFLRRYDQRHVEPRADLDEAIEQSGLDDDPIATQTALASFLELPVRQRCAVILKDVLGCSLEETADTMGTSVQAVKAALVRGRGALRVAAERVAGERIAAPRPRGDAGERQRLERYASLFNARDWGGLEALLGEECRLDLVAKARRHGAEVHQYYGNYAKAPLLRMEVGTVEGRAALLVFMAGQPTPAYFIALEWEGDRVAFIRDYRYVPYIAADLDYAVA